MHAVSGVFEGPVRRCADVAGPSAAGIYAAKEPPAANAAKRARSELRHCDAGLSVAVGACSHDGHGVRRRVPGVRCCHTLPCVHLACLVCASYQLRDGVKHLRGTQGVADEALLPVHQWITASTCKLAYRLKTDGQPAAGGQPLCSLKCSAVGRHLVTAGSVAGTAARHVTLSSQPEARRSGSVAAQRGSWSSSWEAARPLWVKVKDELARPLLTDAAQQGLCAPPPSLLALDAEALDTILQRLPVRVGHAVEQPSAGAVTLSTASAPICQPYRWWDVAFRQAITFVQARDLAGVSATCRQLRGIASADSLWRRLVEQDFPARAGPERRGGWKALYGACHRDGEEARERRLAQRRHPQLRPVPGFRGGNPFMPSPGPGGIVGARCDQTRAFAPRVAVSPSNSLGPGLYLHVC